MELRQLTTFRMLATTLNFTRTAMALNYVQSNVTAQIQALEEELGVRLFRPIRETCGVDRCWRASSPLC